MQFLELFLQNEIIEFFLLLNKFRQKFIIIHDLSITNELYSNYLV